MKTAISKAIVVLAGALTLAEAAEPASVGRGAQRRAVERDGGHRGDAFKDELHVLARQRGRGRGELQAVGEGTLGDPAQRRVVELLERLGDEPGGAQVGVYEAGHGGGAEKARGIAEAPVGVEGCF